MKLYKQKGKKIGIIGLGSTGISVFEAAQDIVYSVICWDDSAMGRDSFSKKYNICHIKEIQDKEWLDLDLIVISPGIASNHPAFLLAKEHNIAISSDIGLFLEENKNSKIIAITGTNGKSTTTALIGHIFKENGYDYHIGGNIGLPCLNLPANAEGYVLELSSFQLDLLDNFNPDIAILLNVTPDHLDRYKNVEEYYKAKMKIFQNTGFKIISTTTIALIQLYANSKKHDTNKLIEFSATILLDKGISCYENKIIDNFFNKQTYNLLENNHLIGSHNDENVAAAFAACRASGVAPEAIINAVASFKGLNHRMQYLGNKNNIRYYNDSKATNTTSAAASLSSLNNIFWLAGGIFKETTLSTLDTIIKNIKKAYLFGQDKGIFASYLAEKKIQHLICDDMKEAFLAAQFDANLEKELSTILLAPACASLDQFKNFEDRGNQFIKLYDAT